MRSFAFSDVQPDEESAAAARALSDVVVEQRLDRIRRVQADRHLEPPEWQEVFGGSQTIVFGTQPEIDEMVADIRAILGRYDDRLADARRRPADGRAVELLLFAQPYRGDLPAVDKTPAATRRRATGPAGKRR
jgi:hypothetical protein